MSQDVSPGSEGEPLGLVGGVGLTEVHVYTQRPAPDGTYSGCPHVHAVTDEGYYILRGTGRVEFHDVEHGMRVVPLVPGQYMHFPPGVVHRLVSETAGDAGAGGLVVLGIMGNAGLAERGEARIYFGPEVDSNPAEFARLAGLARTGGLEGALARRDAAVHGYQGLLHLWHTDRPAYAAELTRFLAVHRAAMAAVAPDLLAQVRGGPEAWALQTARRITALPAEAVTPPAVRMNDPGQEQALGMCGVLRPVLRLRTL